MKDATELRRLLQDVDSRSLLVPPRILRRIIKTDRDIGGLGLQVPHRKSYVIDREPLLRIASASELDVAPNRKLPKTLLLLQRPGDDWLNNTERNEILVQYWQFLFHARLDHETNKQLENGRLNEETVFEHVQTLGQIEFEEINAVLRQERYLLPPINPCTVFAEFLAVYFELHYFARPLLAHYFPAIENHALVFETLSKVVNAERIYQDTRLKNAPDPVMRKGFTDETLVEGLSLLIPAGFDPRQAKCETLCEKASQSTKRGNVVRAALLLKKALDIAPPEDVERIQREANVALDQLAYRLHAALQLHDKETEEWRALLPALLEPASKGVWSISARLLYDLQKVCVDHERDIFELDLGESLRTFGRRPLRRFLPYYADVLLVKHLRSAASRLAGTPVEDEERRRLSIILRAAVHHAEHRLRERIRPVLEQVLDEVELKPANFPEEVARLKMIEEMLDRITHWGFLTMSDVRDAISRNQIKLPDLRGAKELILGDQLLKIDRKLRYELGWHLSSWRNLSAMLYNVSPH